MYRIRVRAGTAQQWKTANPILSEREIGYEYSDGGLGKGIVKMKMGDGATHWNDLAYAQVVPLTVENIVNSESSDKNKIPSSKYFKEELAKVHKMTIEEELIENGISICTNVHSAISNSLKKDITFFRRGKTLNVLFNIEVKGSVNQYATIFQLPSKFKPKINQLFNSNGVPFSVNSTTGAITPQHSLTTGTWIQQACAFELQ